MGVFVQTSLGLWSFLVGAFLCAVYDIFRVFRLRRPVGKLLLFVADFVFCIISAITMSVLFFNLSYGRVRIYALFFALPGFLLWRCTVSRLFIALVSGVLDFLGKTVYRAKAFIKKKWQKLLKIIGTKIYCRGIVKESSHGFGLKTERNVK